MSTHVICACCLLEKGSLPLFGSTEIFKEERGGLRPLECVAFVWSFDGCDRSEQTRKNRRHRRWSSIDPSIHRDRSIDDKTLSLQVVAKDGRRRNKKLRPVAEERTEKQRGCEEERSERTAQKKKKKRPVGSGELLPHPLSRKIKERRRNKPSLTIKRTNERTDGLTD